jgi:2-hydroxy-3-keto-5-methylthiopentenyl-1-phosphate phosphatase
MVSSVLIDFDGTIALEDTTDLVLERFADPEWRQVEADWVAGRIGSRECLSRQIALVKASAAELDVLADEVQIDPAFADFVAAARDMGMRLVIASDGFDRIIARVLSRIGLLLPVVSNKLLPGEGKSWRAEFPYFRDQCRSQSGNCKCNVFGTIPGILLIGDGRSDFCPAEQASLVLAKKSLAIYCRKNAIDHIEIGGFADAKRAILAFCKPKDKSGSATGDTTGAFHA